MASSSGSTECRSCGEPLPVGGRHAGGRPRIYCDESCRREAEKARRYGEPETIFNPLYIEPVAKLGERLIFDVQQLVESVADRKAAAELLPTSSRIIKNGELISKVAVAHLRTNGSTWREVGNCLNFHEDTARREYGLGRDAIERAVEMALASAPCDTEARSQPVDGPNSDGSSDLTAVQLIRSLLEQSTMSLTQLAKRAQVSVSYLSRILNEDRSPSTKVLGALLRVLLSDGDIESAEPAALDTLRHAARYEPSLTPTEVAESLAILRAGARARDATVALRRLARGSAPSFLAVLAVELRDRELNTECNTLLRALVAEPRLRITEIIYRLHAEEQDQLLEALFLHLAKAFTYETLSIIDDLARASLTSECGRLVEAIGTHGAPEAVAVLIRWLRTRTDPLEVTGHLMRMVMQRRTLPVLLTLIGTLEQEHEFDTAAQVRAELIACAGSEHIVNVLPG